MNITYTASTSQYPLRGYNITLLNTTYNYIQTITSNNSANLSYIWNSSQATDGQYYIQIWASDIYGTNSNSTSGLITIDNTPPQFVSTVYTPSSPTAKISGSDAITWVTTFVETNEITYGCDGINTCVLENGIQVNVANTITPTTFSNLGLLNRRNAPARYNYSMRLTDSLGNSNTTPVDAYIVYSTPSITLNAPINNTITKNKTQTFNWTTNSTYPTETTCTLYINDTANTTTYSNNNITLTTINIQEGKQNWYVNCNNTYANTTTGKREITLDTIPPTLLTNYTIPETPTNYTTTLQITLNATFSDATTIVNTTYLIWNGTKLTGNTQTLTSQKVGTYYYNWTANDSIGNEYTTTTYNYTITPSNTTMSLSVNPNPTLNKFPINIICDANTPQTSQLYLYVNDILNATQNNTLTQTLNPLQIGDYNITCTRYSENYTAQTITELLRILETNQFNITFNENTTWTLYSINQTKTGTGTQIQINESSYPIDYLTILFNNNYQQYKWYNTQNATAPITLWLDNVTQAQNIYVKGFTNVIKAARVTLQKADNITGYTTTYQTYTDASGKAQLLETNYNTYRVLVTAEGYVPYIGLHTFQPPNNDITIQLTPQTQQGFYYTMMISAIQLLDTTYNYTFAILPTQPIDNLTLSVTNAATGTQDYLCTLLSWSPMCILHTIIPEGIPYNYSITIGTSSLIINNLTSINYTKTIVADVSINETQIHRAGTTSREQFDNSLLIYGILSIVVLLITGFVSRRYAQGATKILGITMATIGFTMFQPIYIFIALAIGFVTAFDWFIDTTKD